LRAIADKDIATQQQSLIQALQHHQGNEHQRDDITLFATRLGTTASHHHFNKEKNVQSFDLLSFRKLLIENNIVLSFEGKMSQGVLIALVETLKERLATNTDDATQHIIRKIYGVFVELAQNIQNHSLEKVLINQQKIGVGIIVIREDEHKFMVTSGNKLLNDDAEKLRSYCDVVNALGEDELKKMYKENYAWHVNKT